MAKAERIIQAVKRISARAYSPAFREKFEREAAEDLEALISEIVCEHMAAAARKIVSRATPSPTLTDSSDPNL